MKILDKKILADALGAKIVKLKIESSAIAKKVRPGQFVVIMVSEQGERVPLTVVDTEEEAGVITLIFQEVGLTTRLLEKLNTGDSLYALIGPLGLPTEIIPQQRDPAMNSKQEGLGGKNYGKMILVGGGVGIAEIFPVAKALKKAKNYVITILGARTKDLLILENELKVVSDEFHVAIDDGSYGRRGFVTDVLKDVIARSPADLSPEAQRAKGEGGTTRNDDLMVYAVGPIPMMRKVSEVTKPFGIKTIVSLNSLMIDATGMCGVCRVAVGGQMKFTCVDGPEFDGHLVDWDGLTKRNRIYEEKERYICRIYNLC